MTAATVITAITTIAAIGAIKPALRRLLEKLRSVMTRELVKLAIRKGGGVFHISLTGKPRITLIPMK